MNLVGIPQSDSVHVHKSGCKDIARNYHGFAYDDVYHVEAATRLEAQQQIDSTPLKFFPCTRELRR